MMRQSRCRRMTLDSFGVQTVQLLDAIGALNSIVEDIEASIHAATADDDEGDILGLDLWVDSEIKITLDSGCCEHIMDLGKAAGYGTFQKAEFHRGQRPEGSQRGTVAAEPRERR